jgi:hypothetical protein
MHALSHITFTLRALLQAINEQRNKRTLFQNGFDFEEPPTDANKTAGETAAAARLRQLTRSKKRKASSGDDEQAEAMGLLCKTSDCFSSCKKHDLSDGTWVRITVMGREKTTCDNCGISVQQMQACESKSAFACANCPRLLCFKCVQNGFLGRWERRGKKLKQKRHDIRCGTHPNSMARWHGADKKELQALDLMIGWINPHGLD